MKRVRELLLVAACFIAGALGSVFAQQPLVMGLVAGPVGVGYPILVTQPGLVTNPSETSGLDETTGFYFPAAGQLGFAVSGASAASVSSSGWTFPLKAGTAATYACFTSGGLLISSAAAC